MDSSLFPILFVTDAAWLQLVNMGKLQLVAWELLILRCLPRLTPVLVLLGNSRLGSVLFGGRLAVVGALRLPVGVGHQSQCLPRRRFHVDGFGLVGPFAAYSMT